MPFGKSRRIDDTSPESNLSIEFSIRLSFARPFSLRVRRTDIAKTDDQTRTDFRLSLDPLGIEQLRHASPTKLGLDDGVGEHCPPGAEFVDDHSRDIVVDVRLEGTCLAVAVDDNLG